MKIAFLSDSIYPFNKGGKEIRSYELATQLAKRGHEVHFYTMKLWKGKDIIRKNGFYLHGICKNYPLYNHKTRSIKQGIMFGLSAFKLLKKENDFDIIDADHMAYFHLWPAKLASIIKGKPLIITWHEVWGKEYWKSYIGKKGILGYTMEKLSSKLPDKIIAVSEHTKNKLINTLKVNPRKIITIPNAIDIKKINSIKPAKEKSDVIFAGRLNEHKNVDILIKAIKILEEKNQKIKCIIIGDGPEKQNLQHLTNKLNLNKNIVFKGFVDKHEDVLSSIKSSKVFVLPSTREGFGIALIEANACGIPVITVNHKDNASRDLIKQGENGFITELNEKDIADKIKIAIKNNKSMKENCLKSAEKYDWGSIIKMFEEVYK